jgi:WD40 repeat protein/DNA-binding SARP family transcriptional activator/tRNA A-37 threonylcarbamoyl transferase component Bud32
MLEYRALGGLSVGDGGHELSVGGSRQRRLAVVLLMDRNRVVSVGRLAEVVFAGEPTPRAATTLRSYVARLRRVVERAGSGSRVVTRPPGYMLEVGDEAFDVARFEAALAAGRSCLTRRDVEEAARVLRAGLGLWRGGAYAEFADEDWARPEAQRLGELRLVAYELLADAELACGRAAEVASELEPLAAENPLREAFQAKLMLALYRSGRQVEALRAYQAHRKVLAGELGLEPPPELAELESRILVHDDALRELEPGELRLRGYRLGERLGTGRDGTVYAARLPGVDRDIAIRVVPEALANDPGFVRSFDADARQVAALRHPAAVPVYDWWREPGTAYVVMRRMWGGTLRDRVQQGPVPAGEVAALVGRVGSALVALADAGIAHGRVVAESILFDEGGNAYLADFPLGTGDARVPGEDVRDLAAVVAESLTGRRPTGAAIEDAAAPAEVLTAAMSGTEPPSLDSFVSAVVATLSGETAEPVNERPNPYKGLRAFDEPDAEDFFGRDGLVDEVLARLVGGGARRRLVLVVGGSGSGKSSLVRAGLLPRVRSGAAGGSEGWFVTAMVPGASPFKQLAESLRRVAVAESDRLAEELAAGEEGIDRVLRRVVPEGGELLLVVDQLEELFTLADDDEQRGFLDGLTHAVSVADSRLRVVATLRADFYDRPLRFERFGTAVGDATVPIAAMSAAELEAAIVGPVERVGGRVEAALAAELVGAVLHEPAALPSLQYTLYELAERSPDRHLTLAACRELGGVDGAIAARAEELYRSLDDEAREGVRRLFERLVVIGAEGEPTRRRVLRTELAAAAGPAAGEVPEVIEAWAQARLLTLDRHPESREPTVEVAHEALLRDWPRLRGWLEEDREEIVALGHLREAAASWDELDRDPGALYRGTRLDTALQITDRGARALPPLERGFLGASHTARDRERQREVEQLQRTARSNRRLRAQLVALAIALVVALVVGLVAVRQRNRAQDEREIATARELAAAANANVDADPERSILLALEAVAQTRSADGSALPEAEEALHRAVTASRIELRVPGVGGDVDWSPDGTVFVTEGPEDTGLVDIRDVETGESVRSFHGHDFDMNDVAFNHDGTMLATTGDDSAARIWDPETGEELRSLQGPPDNSAGGPSFSADGSAFAAAWPLEGVTRVMDLTTGRTIREITVVQGPGRTSFSPDGKQIAIGSFYEPVAAVVDVRSGAQVFTLSGHKASVSDVAYSPDGRWIATASVDGSARIWEAETGRPRFRLSGHTAGVFAVDWSPDSTRLITGSLDGTAKVWRITDDGATALLSVSSQGTRSGVVGVAFSPDGDRVMTGDSGITAVEVWDVSITGDVEWAKLPAVPLVGGSAVFTPDGGRLVSSTVNGSATVWDLATGARSLTFGPSHPSGDPDRIDVFAIDPLVDGPSGTDLVAIDVSSDGALVATASADGSGRVWDAATGDEMFTVRARDEVDDVAWNPAGDLLATASADSETETGLVTIVDTSGDQVAALPEAPGVRFGSVRFSPDGRLLLTTSSEVGDPTPTGNDVSIWDWERGKIVRTIEASAQRAIYDPTGALIATTAGVDGVAEIWDSETGQKVATLAGHTGGVEAVAFSADGTRLASAGADGTVRLWDPRSGEQLLVLRGHAGLVSSVAFSPDGSRLASVGADGYARVWALDLDDLIEIAEGELTRTLTDQECRQYLHVSSCP